MIAANRDSSVEEDVDSLRQVLYHYRLPVMVVCFGIGLSILCFFLTLNYNTRQLERDFLFNSKNLYMRLAHQFDSYMQRNELAQARIRVSLPLTDESFARSVNQQRNINTFSTFLWVPNGRPFTAIFSQSTSGKAPETPVSLANHPELAAGFQQSSLTNEGVVTEPLSFLKGMRGKGELAHILPVSSRKGIEGYVVSILDIIRLFEAELHSQDGKQGADAYIYDDTFVDKRLIYYRNMAEKNSNATNKYAYHLVARMAPFAYENTLSLSGRIWRVLLVPSHLYLATAAGIVPWLVLAGCLLLTGLVSLFIFSLTTRNLVIQQSVERQTKELFLLTQSLVESKEKIRAIVDNTVDGIITINQKGIVESYNRACVRIFGYAPDEVIGKNIKMLMPEPYQSEHDRYLENYRKTGEKKIIGIGREVSGCRKNGMRFPIDLSVSEVNLQGKRLFSGIVRDITERKEAEAEAARYTIALERSNKELDDFAYIASHDLKEPLRGLHNHARFLLEDNEGKLAEDSMSRLHRMTALTKRMEKLINDLLYFSRLGRQDMAIQPTDLNVVIYDIENTLEHFLDERNGRIVIPEPLPFLVCDKVRITEVFRNLVTNALKYNSSNERIVEIGFLKERTNEVGLLYEDVIYVKDNGVGIAPEFKDEVFRIFRRLNNTKNQEEGTGVGLTFVKKIIERHGGTIWLESETGKGTTFYFTLEGTEHGSKSV